MYRRILAGLMLFVFLIGMLPINVAATVTQEEPIEELGTAAPSVEGISGLTIAGANEVAPDGTGHYIVQANEGVEISFGPSVLEQENDLTYQWQNKNEDTGEYVDIPIQDNPTANSEELTVITGSEMVEYRCIVSSKQDVSYGAVATFTIDDDIDVFEMKADLIDAVRDQMVQRHKYYTATLISEEPALNYNELSTQLYAHTGVPTEGDYLKNHSKSVSFVKEECTDGMGTTYSFTMSYITTAEQEATINDAIVEIIREFDHSSPYETIRDIFTYIRSHVQYDDYHLNLIDYWGHEIKQTAYGALIDGTAVCEGYASLFYRLSLECGIDARLITGVSWSGNHAWNIVDATGNGEYYGIDADSGLFLFGENGYAGGGLTPDPEYRTDEFLATFPMVWDNYKTVADYSYDADTKTLTVTSDVPDFYNEPNNFTSCWPDEIVASAETVIIQDGVKRIGNYAFYGFYNLRTVKMADSVKELGEYAFSACYSLSSVELSQALERIDYRCFYATPDEGPLEIWIPDSVRIIENEAFWACEGISGIHISENSQLEYIGERAFWSTFITEIFIPATVTEIGVSAFERCRSLEKCVFDENSQLTQINDSVFSQCYKLRSVNLPDTLTHIGKKAFYKCEELRTINLPKTLISIGASAFASSGLTRITLPENLEVVNTSLGNVTQIHIPANLREIGTLTSTIKNITVSPENKWYCIQDGVLFTKDGTKLLSYLDGSSRTTYTVPDGVRVIGAGAFSKCNLKSIVLPEGLETINGSVFAGSESLQTITLPSSLKIIGASAFASCSKLKNINIPEGVTSIGNSAFSHCYVLNAVNIPVSVTSIGSYAFYDCDALTEIVIPGSVEIIRNASFAACGLKKIVVSEGIREIEKEAFRDNRSLTTLELPASLEKIGTNLLKSSSSPRTILYAGTKERWNSIDNQSSSFLPVSKITFGGQDIGLIGTQVIFDGNGSEETWDPKTVKTNSAYGELPEPIREGYTFYGWFTSPTGGQKITAESVVYETSTHTLYAHWVDTVAAQGTAGDVQWMLHSSGELVIYGIGAIPDYQSSGTAPWLAEKVSITSITICEGITRVGVHSFNSCSKATSIKLPDSLLSIGEYAFNSCGFQMVAYPNSLQKIEGYAFRGCSSLKELVIPENVQEIGDCAFAFCHELNIVQLQGGVENIGSNVFYDCVNMTQAELKIDGAALGNGMFHNCDALTNVTIAEGLTRIGIDTFKKCISLKNITLPDSITHIGNYAFVDCEKLEQVEFGSGLQEIGVSAFANCSVLAQINLPEKLQEIKAFAFVNNIALEMIEFPETLTSIGRGAFNGCSGLLSVEIGANVTSIGVRAFAGCSGLQEVQYGADLNYIPLGTYDGCASIETVHIQSFLSRIEEGAFGGCNNLQTIYWLQTQKEWDVIQIDGENASLQNAQLICQNVSSYPVMLDPCGGSVDFDTIQVNYMDYYGELPIPTREGYLFRGWFTEENGGMEITASTKVAKTASHTIYARWWSPEESGTYGDDLRWGLYGDGTLSITGEGVIGALSEAPWAAYKNRIRFVVIGEGISGICDKAFEGCVALTSVEFSASLTEIGEYAFKGCTSLEKIRIPEGVSRIGKRAFEGCTGLNYVVILSKNAEVGEYLFSNCTGLEIVETTMLAPYMFDRCSELIEVKLLAEIDRIPEGTFNRCGSLKDFVIPETVKYIEKEAFQFNGSVVSIEIPDSVITIGDAAFLGCDVLQDVKLSKNLKSIGNKVFYWCGKLKSVEFPSSLTYLGYDMFNECNALEYVKLPQNITVIPSGFICVNESLKTIEIPETVVEIQDFAFSSCYALETIIVPENVKIIGDCAFSCCESLKNVVFCGNAVEFESSYVFEDTRTTVYYPYGNNTWTEDLLQNYHGTLTWKAWKTLGNDLSCTHKFKQTQVVNDCQGGYTVYGCDCGFSYCDNFTAGTHSFTNYVSNQDATCTKDGTKTAKCDTCDVTDTIPDEGSILDHSWKRTNCTDVRICENCGGTDGEVFGHSFGDWQLTIEAGCTANGEECRYCEICDHYESREIQATGHTSVADPAVEATCEGTGLSEGSHCDQCGEILVAQEEVPALGHQAIVDEMVVPGCTQSGLTEGSHCERCQKILVAQEVTPAPGHQWDEGIVVAEPAEYSTGLQRYTCGQCGEERTKILPALGHVHAYAEVVTEPACSTQGYSTYTCSCGESYMDLFVDALGHEEIADTGKEATCTETGLTDGSHCERCNEVLTEQKEIPALGHLWDEGTVTLEPTDETTGTKRHTCERCGETAEMLIPTLNHVHDYVATVTEATCTEQGYTTFSCDCGESYVDDIVAAVGHQVVTDTSVSAACTTSGLTEGSHCSICGTVLVSQEMQPAFGHEWDDGVEIAAPTKYTSGLMLSTCGNCSQTKSASMPALEHIHSYEATVTDPTCTAQGFTTYSCQCGDSYVDDLVDALSHLWDDGIVTSEPTEETEGIRIYTCERCDKTREESIPVKEHVHDYSSAVTAPTCTEDGYTTHTCRCGDSYEDSVIAALGHTEVIDAAIAPTCTTPGLTEGKHCSACGEVLTEQTPVPIADHSWQNYICSICGVEKTYRVDLEDVMPERTDTVWINGVPYEVQYDGASCYVDLPASVEADIMVTYSYHVGNAADIHTQYPSGMNVWILSDEGGTYTATRVEELDDILQYSGMSIRVTGKKGIRMITSIEKSKKKDLTSDGLAGYTLKEYGTVVAWASQLENGNPLVLGKSYAKSNYAYKKAVADPVFAYDGDLMQYTNVLVGFNLDQCRNDLAMRPYMILADADGNEITLYGGIVQRSIGYIAAQNAYVFDAIEEANAYKYIWDIIRHVYGEDYVPEAA